MNTLRNITNPERFTVTKSLKNEIEIAKKREQLIEYMKEKEELNKFQKDKTAEMNERNLAPLTKLLSRETTNDKGEKKVISLMDGFDELKKNITDLSSIQFVTDNTGNKWSVAELLASKNPEIDLNNFSPEKRVIIDDTRNSIKEREDILNEIFESQVIYDDKGKAISQAEILDAINGKLVDNNIIKSEILNAMKELSPKESIKDIADSVEKLVGMEMLKSKGNKELLESIEAQKEEMLNELDRSTIPLYVKKKSVSVSFPFKKETYTAKELLEKDISQEDFDKLMALNVVKTDRRGKTSKERLKLIQNIQRLKDNNLLVESEIATNPEKYFDKTIDKGNLLYEKIMEKLGETKISLEEIKGDTEEIKSGTTDLGTAVSGIVDRAMRKEDALAQKTPVITPDSPKPKGTIASTATSSPKKIKTPDSTKELFPYAGTSLEKELTKVTPIDESLVTPPNVMAKSTSPYSWLWKGTTIAPPLLEKDTPYLNFKNTNDIAINKKDLDTENKLIIYKKKGDLPEEKEIGKISDNVKEIGKISDNVKEIGKISDNVKEFIFGKEPTENFIYKNFSSGNYKISDLRKDINKSIDDGKIKIDDLKQIDEFYNYVGFTPTTGTVNANDKKDQIRIIQDVLKEKKGSGITNYQKYSKFYKDTPPKHGYKIDPDGSFGDLIIDVKSLLGFQKLIAYTKNGEKVINQKVNKDFIDLVTKRRFNKNAYYSPETEDLFYKLVSLAGMPIHESSEKYKKIINKKNNNNIVRMVSNPNDLIKRMNVLTGQILAGNSSLQVKNELSEVIDMLLKLDIITKEQHGILFNNFLN